MSYLINGATPTSGGSDPHKTVQKSVHSYKRQYEVTKSLISELTYLVVVTVGNFDAN